MKKIITYIGFFGIFASFAPVAFAGYFNGTPISQCDVQITRTLQVGSENSEVYVLQNFLARSGYLSASANGYFGPATKAAVIKFQRANYISTTGSVGEMTRNAINERMCDQDVLGDSLSQYSYGVYGYSSGTTYVSSEDPYVQVISPTYQSGVVYQNPPSGSVAVTSTASRITTSVATTPVYGNTLSVNSINSNAIVNTVSSNTSSQIAGVNIIYTPSVGYIYNIIPKSGSLTINSPVKNTVYREGDTVSLSWYTNNLPSNQYQIILENLNTKQSRAVAFTTSNTTSFVLSKDLLDAVCGGSCDNNQQGSFRIIIATPTTDIAGVTSVLRATIDPITVKRPLGISTVTVTASQTPVSSGDVFKLFINVPTNAQSYTNEQLSLKLRAVCVNSVQVSIAGVQCGSEFTFPIGTIGTQQEIPVKATNTTFYKQDVGFEVAIVNSLGQIVSVGQTKVTVNAAPFNW